MATTYIQVEAIETRRLAWPKKILFAVLYALVMVFSFAVIGEILLRVLPLGAYKSGPFRQYDSNVGLSLIPNMNVVHHRGCFAGEVVTNRWGMRDRDRTLEKSPGEFRIAMLGDSAVEAVQAGDFEGVLRWVIGTHGRLPFVVHVQSSPTRVVVDIEAPPAPG